MKELTDFGIENITNLFMENYTASYISKFLELPVNLVNNFIKENQLRQRRDLRNLSLLIKLCSENYTKDEVAEKMNLSEERVYALVKKNKLEPHFREKLFLHRKNKIINEYKKEPCSIKVMSQKLKLSENFIRKVYKENRFVCIVPHYINKMSVLTEEMYKQLLIDLRNTNLSLSKLSDKYKVSRQRIHQIQKKEKIQRP